MDDPSSADVPKVPEEMSTQFNSALKRAREIALKLQGVAPAVSNNAAPPDDEPPRKMAPDSTPVHNIVTKAATDYITEDEVVSDSMLIQTSFVGLVIGKGGETIRNFQERTQCKMYMIQDGEYAKAPEKLLTFQGLKSRVEEAKRLVKEFIEDKDRYSSGPPGTTKVEVTVPQDCVGLIIGKGGETIKKISSETNCRTGYADTLTKNGERVCVFEGLPQDIQAAQQRVREIVEMVIRKNSPQTMNIVLTEGSELYEVVVTASKAGMIVGRGGEFIQLIMQSTGTHIEFNKGVVDNGQTKTFLISGAKEQIDRARQMMVDKAGENNVNPLQPPTNVVVSYVPAQPAWSDPYAAAAAVSGYDPSLYYQNYQQQHQQQQQQQQQDMWAQMPGATAADAQAVDPNVANYYANMTPEEYAAAWASYYQQYQQYAYSAAAAGSDIPAEGQQLPTTTTIPNEATASVAPSNPNQNDLNPDDNKETAANQSDVAESKTDEPPCDTAAVAVDDAKDSLPTKADEQPPPADGTNSEENNSSEH